MFHCDCAWPFIGVFRSWDIVYDRTCYRDMMNVRYSALSIGKMNDFRSLYIFCIVLDRLFYVWLSSMCIDCGNTCLWY